MFRPAQFRTGITTLLAIAFIQGSYVYSQSEGIAEEILKSRSAPKDVVFGKVVSVDEHRLNIREGDATRALIVTPETVIEIDGKPIPLSDLPPDLRLRLTLDPEREDTITRIDIAPNAPLPADLEGPPRESTALPNAMKKPYERAADAEEAQTQAHIDADPLPRAPVGLTLESTPRGLVVSSVKPNSPATAANLQVGDFIKQVAGTNIATAEGFHRQLHRQQPASRVALLVERDGEEFATAIVLPTKFVPQLANRPQQPRNQTPPVSRNVITASHLGWVISSREGKVEIVSIEPNSAADLSSLQVGDEIVSVENQIVKQPGEVMAFLQQYADEPSVTLTIRRDGKQLTRGLILPTSLPISSTVTANKANSLAADTSMEDLLQMQAAQEQRIQQLENRVEMLRAQVEVLKQAQVQTTQPAAPPQPPQQSGQNGQQPQQGQQPQAGQPAVPPAPQQ